jgi:hypothetical protein
MLQVAWKTFANVRRAPTSISTRTNSPKSSALSAHPPARSLQHTCCQCFIKTCQPLQKLTLVIKYLTQEFLNKMHCLQHFESWATYTPQLAQVVTNAVTFRLAAPSNTSTTTTENSTTMPVKLQLRGEKLVSKGPEQQTLDLRRLTNSSESNERPSAPLSTRRVKSVGDSQQNPVSSSRMPQIEKSLDIQILRDHLSPVTRNVIQKAQKSCVRSKSNPENELACACEGAQRPERNLSASEIQLDFEIQLKAFQNQAAVEDATTTPGEWIEVCFLCS